MHFWRIFWCLMVMGVLHPAWASDADFRIQDIRVEGLQRLPVERVFRHFTLQAGEQASRRELVDITRRLYAGGDFDDVQMGRDGDVLVVMVRERPSIAKIDISGNKAISTDDLQKGLSGAGLKVGEVFRRSTLDGITGELERQYVAQGRYGARVETEYVPLPRNRVELKIRIHEGKPARIRDINVVGNDVFTDEDILRDFQLKPSHFWSFIKGDDKYARERFGGDLERLRSYYLDRGYVNVSIDSTQVTITPDRRDVYLTVNVTEGKQYRVRDVKLAGELIVEEGQLRPLVVLKEGQVFSQQLLTYTKDLLTRRLGNEGYTFAEVNGFTEVNDDDETVDVTFYVEPGRKAYVRRVTFAGNSKTRDEVLRRELRQFERAPANSSLIDLSRSRLERLGYFSTVQAETPRVPGNEELIDVAYKVEEQPSGSIGANIGYSDASGVIFGANVSQNNFRGSGNRVAFAVSRSSFRDSYSFSHTNPYYTLDGVSRGFSAYYTKYDYSETSVSAYAADRKGVAVNYGYPISEYSRLNFGLGFDQIDITTGDWVALPIWEFINGNINTGQGGYGDSFRSVKGTASLSTSTLNRGVMPDRGWSSSISLEVTTPVSDLSYYKVSWSGQRYFPMGNRWVLRARADVAYGDGYGDTHSLPFYESYYAGGIGSIRGYESRSLGPRAPAKNTCSTTGTLVCSDPYPEPVGGNLLNEISLELIFPTPFAPNSRSLRTFFFVDGGNVFQTEYGFGRDDFDLEEYRYSAGVGLSWLTAIGPIGFSFARPIQKQDGDDTEVFQFSLGQVF